MEVLNLSRRPEPARTILFSADIDDILNKYGDILDSYHNLLERNSIYASFKRTKTRLDVLFPLKEHPVHGIKMLSRNIHYQLGTKQNKKPRQITL